MVKSGAKASSLRASSWRNPSAFLGNQKAYCILAPKLEKGEDGSECFWYYFQNESKGNVLLNELYY
jgi:hypothetical protein